MVVLARLKFSISGSVVLNEESFDVIDVDDDDGCGDDDDDDDDGDGGGDDDFG